MSGYACVSAQNAGRGEIKKPAIRLVFSVFLVGTRGFEPPTPDTPCHCDKSAVTLVNTGAETHSTVYANSAFFAKSALYTSMGYSWFFPILLHTTYVSINTRLKIRKRIDMKEINKILLIFCLEPVNLI